MSLDVEVQDVRKSYGNMEVLKSVSLHVKNGEFLTILGPSGSGKTTLLKIISGFEYPTSGRVLIGNQDITYSPPHKRGIGMVFQNYALFPHMTVYENIRFPLAMRRMNKKTIEEKVHQALELVQLTQFKDRYPAQLSGGQKQRVALARSVVFDPPVLLLDEPLSALDKQLRLQMQLEIKALQEKVRITTISVTHDQEEALTMSTRICIIHHGQIQQLGTPREIYEHPANRFVAEFIGETNLVNGEVSGREGDDVIVKTRLGEVIRVRHALAQDHRGEVALSVRPEAIRLLQDHERMDNTFQGLVQEIVYLGESVKFHLSTGKGEIFRVKINARHAGPIEIGRMLRFGWNAGDGILLTG